MTAVDRRARLLLRATAARRARAWLTPRPPPTISRSRRSGHTCRAKRHRDCSGRLRRAVRTLALVPRGQARSPRSGPSCSFTHPLPLVPGALAAGARASFWIWGWWGRRSSCSPRLSERTFQGSLSHDAIAYALVMRRTRSRERQLRPARSHHVRRGRGARRFPTCAFSTRSRSGEPLAS